MNYYDDIDDNYNDYSYCFNRFEHSMTNSKFWGLTYGTKYFVLGMFAENWGRGVKFAGHYTDRHLCTV